MGIAVGACVGAAVGSFDVGACVGCSVGFKVVGVLVGSLDGTVVGAPVGLLDVGSPVGVTVGRLVGPTVLGAAVSCLPVLPPPQAQHACDASWPESEENALNSSDVPQRGPKPPSKEHHPSVS